jgi:hypothetical protein
MPLSSKPVPPKKYFKKAIHQNAVFLHHCVLWEKSFLKSHFKNWRFGNILGKYPTKSFAVSQLYWERCPR